MELIERVKALSKDYFEDVVFFRRHFHAAPELSMQEHKTAAFIASRLEEMGIPFEEGIAETGLVATIEGKKPASAMVALRADMDALPILEQNNVEYKSANPGVMHACGHDVHMAGMLGTARILHTLRDQWEGTVKILFQPSEENYPGGASLMLQAGIFEDQRPDAMFGQHVYPGLPVGKVGIRSGRYMASTDEVYITVKGKGGHAATPHLIIDPVVIASHIVIALQQIVSRHASPTVPTVLSFGKIMGEGLTNVIPDEVKLEGTFRTFDEEWREKAHLHIREVAVFVAQGMGAECDVFIDKGYPFLINHEKTTAHFQAYASEYLGQENVEELDLSMTAEDFAYYSQRFPTCFYRLGTRNVEQGITANQHTATFDVDEKALETGMGLMAWAAMQELKHKQG
ncbi:MAG: M20 family metallopeptidase [Bacteroidales bacterium]